MPHKSTRTDDYFRKIKKLGSITEYEHLNNNLRVLYVHVKKSPTVSTCIVYHVGSQHEGKGETGLAHMLEHMLFKNTGTKGPTWKTLEEKGAILNATTWLDRTTYYFNMPAQYLREMLMVEADRMRNIKLTSKEFEPERTSVLSEYELRIASEPEDSLDLHVVATAIQAHGYHHETIGFKSDIENYTVQKLQSFYNRHYWPDNATLIVAGDVPEQKLFTDVHTAFGNIHRTGPRVVQENIPEMVQEGVRRVVLERNTPLRALTVAFKAPEFTKRAWTALYLAILHLTDGKTSPLYKKLVQTHLATSVSGSLYPTRDPFLAFFQVRATEKSSYEKIEMIVQAEIESLQKTLLPKQRVEALKTHAHAEELFSRDGTLRIASQLAEYVATGDWSRYETGLNELKDITAKEIKDAVATYFTRSQSTVGTLEPATKI